MQRTVFSVTHTCHICYNRVTNEISSIHKKHIALVPFRSVDEVISIGFLTPRPQNMLCAYQPVGYEAYRSIPVSVFCRAQVSLLQSVGRGYGASSRANRGRAVAFRRYRSTRRAHVPEMYPHVTRMCRLYACPGMRQQMPLTMRSISTPASDASYRRLIITGSCSAFIFRIIRPPFPALAKVISWSISRFSSGMRLKRATSRRWKTGAFRLPCRVRKTCLAGYGKDCTGRSR